MPLEIRLRILLTDPPSVLEAAGDVAEIVGFPPYALLSGEIPLRLRIHPDDADVAEKLFAATLTAAAWGAQTRNTTPSLPER